MKKITLLFIAVSLSLISCNSEEKSPEPQISSDDVLLKSTTYIHPETSENVTSTFTYNGSKIVSVANEDFKSIYTYTGDFITKMEFFEQGNVLNRTETYDYKDGILATSTKQSPGSPFVMKRVYTHNSDGSIEYVSYRTNTGTNQTEEYRSGKFIFSNGNVTSFISSYKGNVLENHIIEYDTKNNPFRNITGLNLIVESDFSAISVNNETNRSMSFKDQSTPNVWTTTYIYDSNGFPVELKQYSDGNLVGTNKYAY